MAKAQQQEKVPFVQRLKQIGMVFSFTAKQDKWFLPLVFAVTIIPLAATAVVIMLGYGWLWLPIGIMAALLGALIVLNLRANAAMMNQAEGQPGAAASILQSMRGNWRVTPAVSTTTQLDMVHLVIGRPGVILLGEGNHHRVRGLITQERKRLSKVIGSAPLYDYIVGTGEDELSIRKMRRTLTKLPPNLKPVEVNALDKRLTALTARPQMPKGAIPKNMRPPKGAFRAMRGTGR
jgi:hypothetical protein